MSQQPGKITATSRPKAPATLVPGITGFSYADLHEPTRLRELSAVFDAEVEARDPDLFATFSAYRADPGSVSEPTALSDLLVRLAPYVGDFVARLFGVESERAAHMEVARREFETVFTFRAEIVQKLGALTDEVPQWDLAAVIDGWNRLFSLIGDPKQDEETRTAVIVLRSKQLVDQPDAAAIAELRRQLQADSDAAKLFAAALAGDDATFAAALFEAARRWCAAAASGADVGRDLHDWMSFKSPKRINMDDLVEHRLEPRAGGQAWITAEGTERHRDGFALTDARAGLREVLYEVDHCIYCHERDTDSCAKGMRNRKAKDGIPFKTNPLGVIVSGCPLGEKISEMHVLKRHGDDIGALALVVLDNPMCPGTGHRICNDCMKGCIYQKTEPVNIPQIETNVLTSVLHMPWGFEIYSFLTRWNPLNVARPHALPYNGRNVLVAGMGPAGYTLSHYLLNEGFGVVGIDGLKIEPLPEELTGAPGRPPRPVRDFDELNEPLGSRTMLGFGGVAEYGITVRWDKNFLKVIYLNLLRRRAFCCYGGVRFGGTLTVDDAWSLGFDHIAVATGAGKPTIIGLRNNLLRGIRKASDFLMALQLTGAAKTESLANLQVRLPAGVIGGGLTAIDTATEVMAYYPVQVEKMLARYEKLVARRGEPAVRAGYDREELGILDELLSHGHAVRAERERAAAAGEQPDFARLVNEWGGVTLFYRKRMHDAPAYRQNHEEIAKALEEGIRIVENMDPQEAFADEYGSLDAVLFRHGDGSEPRVPLRSLFIAAGTSPNTIYEQEHPGTFTMDGRFFQRFEPAAGGVPALTPMHDTAAPKVGQPAPLTSYQKGGRYISFYGDNHPVYAGNVVKAMASAKDGYPYIVQLFREQLAALKAEEQPQRDRKLEALHTELDELLRAVVVEVKRLTPTIIEVVVRARMQARKFRPGQFYRVQNLERLAPVVGGTPLASEGLALTGAWVDAEQGLISLIALEMGGSSRLCATWKPGDPLVLMGVTGEATDIPAGQTVLLVGGGLGNAVQFSIGKALRAAGSRVIYFAGYRSARDVFKVEDIEAASDVIVWAVDRSEGAQKLPVTRPQDRSFIGNVVEAMVAYGSGQLGEQSIPLNQVDRMIVIGSDRMMSAVKDARHGVLKPYLKPGHTALGSINSPMQCMMKGVCAQCLCKHVEPETGKEYFVYSCYNQDQELDRVDFQNLNARLRQNSVQEKLSNAWLDYVLEEAATPAKP